MKIQSKDTTYVRPASPSASEGAPSSSSPGDSKQLFTALVESCGWEPREITRSARGSVNRAVAELRAVGATPEEVARRAGNYRKRWPNVSITPSALARHWAELAQAPRETFAGRQKVEMDAESYAKLRAKEDAAIESAEVESARRDWIVKVVEAEREGHLSSEDCTRFDQLLSSAETHEDLSRATAEIEQFMCDLADLS